MSTAIDLTSVVEPILGVVATVVTGVIGIYVPKALAAFQAHTGIVLTENQRQTVLAAVQTAAGVLETELDKGAVKVEHITVANPIVASQAQAVLAAVPTAATALGLSSTSIARMIVGAVDTSPRPAPVTTTGATTP